MLATRWSTCDLWLRYVVFTNHLTHAIGEYCADNLCINGCIDVWRCTAGCLPSLRQHAGDVDQAATIIERFQAVPEKAIPQAVLKDARGLAIMTVIKAGFGFSGRGGTGVVVARTRNGWSGPSAIGTGGAGFGLQIGAQVTEFVMILNTDAAVQAFSRDVNVTLGGDISVAAGPIGRTAEAAITPVAAIYTYSRSQGLFAGVSLEGTVIGTRNDANAEYYGRP